jgi:hypothetical protein
MMEAVLERCNKDIVTKGTIYAYFYMCVCDMSCVAAHVGTRDRRIATEQQQNSNRIATK